MPVFRTPLLRSLFAVTLGAAACSDDSAASSPTGSLPREEASSAASSSADVPVANRAPLASGRPRPAAFGGADQASELAELRDAGIDADHTTYKISFSNTPCMAPCPVYSVSIDQAGSVAFDGLENVAKAGKSTKKVAPSDAAEVYEALRAAGYFELGDVYRTQADGCEHLVTDGTTHNWSVERDGETKVLSHYLGCIGADLTKVEAVLDLLVEKSGVAEWIGADT